MRVHPNRRRKRLRGKEDGGYYVTLSGSIDNGLLNITNLTSLFQRSLSFRAAVINKPNRDDKNSELKARAVRQNKKKSIIVWCRVKKIYKS